MSGTGVRDWEANMSVFYLSNIYSGYLTEPSYETVEKHDLRFICTGDIDTLKELLNR